MNRNKILFFLGLLILTSSFKIGYDWAQAWVDDKVLLESELPKKIVKKIKSPDLTLVLMTKKDLITTPSNGNTYLRCYLINLTDTTATIGRSDATITGFSTEILKDNIWQHFQHPIGSGCGNSYWTQKLERKQVLSIQVDHAENGPIKVPFRIKYTHNNIVIYSNVISVDIDQKNYDRVGKRNK
jgi:hypothetical protein